MKTIDTIQRSMSKELHFKNAISNWFALKIGREATKDEIHSIWLSTQNP